jgi:hypothetical protein
MATKKKPADEGFLTTAAQTIGSTLGQLVKKAGEVTSPAPKKAVKKAVVAVKKKVVAVKKKAVAVEKKAVTAVKKKVVAVKKKAATKKKAK